MNAFRGWWWGRAAEHIQSLKFFIKTKKFIVILFFFPSFFFSLVAVSRILMLNINVLIQTEQILISVLGRLTVNSVTCTELVIGSNSPASLYISRTKAIHEVDFPSVYNQSSCSGIVNNFPKDDPRFSTSTKISGRSRPYMEHKS
jgi:hypothetical protein